MNALPHLSAPRCSAFVAALALLAACGSDLSPSAAGSGAADLHTVARGPMRISVRESAELKATHENRVRSEVEGQSTIIYLVPEGSVVEEGERLVELDVSDVEEKCANQDIAVERASFTLVNARQNMAILEKELAAEIAQANSQHEIAKIDVEKFLGRPVDRQQVEAGGETIPLDVVPTAVTGPQDPAVAGDTDPDPDPDPDTDPDPDGATAISLAEQERERELAIDEQGSNHDMLDALRKLVADQPQYTELPDKVLSIVGTGNLDRDMGELGQQILEQKDEINLAYQQLAISYDKVKFSRKLAEQDYISRESLAGDELEFARNKSRVSLAWQSLDILVSYTLRKTKIDLDLKLGNAELGLARVEASNSARRLREEAELHSREKEYEIAEERLANFIQQIENAVIRAPAPGLVVFAEMDGRGREMIQEGSTVRDRQTILILPDVSKMTAEMKIQEADIDKVRVGQPASIQIDAFPDKVLTGRVTRVSPVADSGSRWSNSNLKVYKTWVDLDGVNTSDELRPNMSATVEILVGQVPDTIAIPVSAVRRQRAVKYLWKATPSGPVTEIVKIGRNTLTHVEILEGVAVGDQVYLARPPGMLPPEFEQPETISEVIELTPGRDNDEGADNRRGEAGPDATPPAQEVTRESYQQAVLDKLPQFKELIETDGFRAFRDPELRAAIENDPELSAMQATMMEQMRAQMGERGPGGGPGGGRGGEGRRGPDRDGGNRER